MNSDFQEAAQRLAFHCQKFEQLLSGLTPDERETLLTLLERAISAAEQEINHLP